ncbi:MAG: hypothetical protein JF599_00500 [Verrucomicrobia bacterium]|nr:hypothetical protein [Verrucomicrobiota bacterium]
MNEEPHQSQYISDTWSSKWDGVMSAQREGLNWLFALNVGGVAGILTYASAKETTPAVIAALISFSIGLLCLVYYALRYYYAEEHCFYAFRADVIAYRRKLMDWDSLVKREDARPSKYKDCEVAAIASTACAVGGIVASSLAIL